MKQLAIIGPTASGKSDLALRLALEHNALILSIDSLSIYREIDIASAKPSPDELARVRHFGINELSPDEHFSVSTFISCYHRAVEAARNGGNNLIIVGGTGFYLKSLLTGLSPVPDISPQTREKAAKLLTNLPEAHALLHRADPEYMQNIEPGDGYRIEKMLHLYLETGQTPSQWFAEHPSQPVIPDIDLYEIDVERPVLRERIKARTRQMVDTGLVDEVAALEHKYARAPNSMKAIGIVEVLDYLDGKVSKEEMVEQIATHTAQLAKRQQTFNRHQFSRKKTLCAEAIYVEASRLFKTVENQIEDGGA